MDPLSVPPSSATASIRTTVTGIAGSPLGGVLIVLNGPGITRAGTTGADGTFTFSDLPAGVYVLTATLTGFTCGSRTVNMEAGETLTASIPCAAEQPPGGSAAITGSVTADGTPLGGAWVRLTGLPFTGAVTERAAIADSAGRFAFTGLTPGAYTLSAAATGFSCLSPTVVIEAGLAITTADISCAEDGSGGEPPAPPTTGLTGKIAFERDGRVMVVSPDGSNAITFIDGRAPSWSADGRKLVFQRPGCLDWSVPPYFDCDDIWMINADGSGLSPIMSSQWYLDYDPVWSPDGSRVAFVRLWHGPDQTYLVVAKGNSPLGWSETIPSMWWPLYRPTWSPDGSLIAFTCEGPPPRWESDICVSPSNYDGGYFSDTNSNAGLVKVTHDTWTNADPAWSPDGTRIAFATNRDAADGRSYISLINPNGTGFTRQVPGRRPAWSPDGTRIVFVGEADAPGLYIVNVDGSGLVRITDDPADTAPSWGP